MSVSLYRSGRRKCTASWQPRTPCAPPLQRDPSRVITDRGCEKPRPRACAHRKEHRREGATKMPVSCAASGCKSRYTLEAREKGITFHRFPRSNPALLDKWCRAMKRATSTGELWMPSRYQRLCSLHFQQSCFDTTGQTKRLREDVIPSIFNFPEDTQRTEVSDNQVLETSTQPSDIPVISKAENEDLENVSVSSNADALVHCQVQLQDHPYFIPDIDTLKKKLQASEDSRAQKEKELRNAKDREKRLRQTCHSIYCELIKRNLLSSELLDILQPYEDIPLERFKKPESEYSSQQRMFSLTLQLNDPLAYRYLRKESKLPLPGPRRLRQWLKSDREGPGINTLAIKALIQKKQAHPQLYTKVSLALGIFSIQQSVAYDSCRNELVGFVNLGKGGSGSGSQDVANEVLMFMLGGTVGHWNVPIAYFYVKSLTPQAQKQLLVHVLHELCEKRFEVVAVSMDRHPRNEEMCTMLGCTFTDPWSLQTHFSLPNRDYRHYVVFDVGNELHTVSDVIEELGTVQSPEGAITWRYITDLMNLPRMFRLVRNWEIVKMTLLCNKLSDTVANALQFVQELNYEHGHDLQAIINFIQIIGRLFDICNSSSVRLKGDKSPINQNNVEEKLQVLRETREYLLTLTTCENEFLFQSSRAQCTVGLLVNIASLSELLPRLLMDQDCITTSRFRSHHLTAFFNCVRHKDVRPTAFAVNQAIEKLFSQFGFVDPTPENDLSFVHTSIAPSLTGSLQHIPFPFEETSIKLPCHVYQSCLLDVTLDHSEMYIAGWVVREAFKQLSCNKCRWALVSSATPQDFTSAYHLLQVNGGVAHFVPSNGAWRTVQTAEKELHCLLKYGKRSISALMLEHHVLSTLGPKDIFDLKEHIPETELGINNHHFQLLRLVASLYYALREPYINRIKQACRRRARVTQTLSRPLELYFHPHLAAT